VYVNNVEIIAVSEIYKCVSGFLMSEDPISQPPTVTVGQVAIERNVPLLFSGELDSGHCNVLLQVEKKEGLGIFHQVHFL
jgi:hypothetical protein